MITVLTVLIVLLAGLNVWMAWRTLQSQEASKMLSLETKQVLADTKDLQDRFFTDMNDALQQMKAFQEMMNTRERLTRQERARTAVQILLAALQHQITVLDGQWVPSPRGLTLKGDPLGPVRAYQGELGWIPPCEWRDKCQEIFKDVGPLDRHQGDGARHQQLQLLEGHWRALLPNREQRLYEKCLGAIDEML